MTRRTLIGILLVAIIAAGVAFAQETPKPAPAEDVPKPSGTIEFEGGVIAVGIGFSWGSGTLTYQGKKYPITASGFDVGDLGGSSVQASGTVYNLINLDDFDGNYSGFDAGAALVAGGDAATLQNEHGVRILLTMKTEGVRLILAGDTIGLKLKK